MADVTAKFSLNNENLSAAFDLSEEDTIDTVFKIEAAGTTWGSIDGTLSNQKDLQAALDLKADKLTVEADFEALNDTITENYDTLDNKIDTVQSDLSGDISALSQTVTDNNANVNARINSTNITVNNLSATVNNNYSNLNGKITLLTGNVEDNYTTLDNKINSVDSELSGSIGELETTISNLDGTVQSNYTILDTKIDTAETTLQGNIDTLSGTVQSNYTDLTDSINSNVIALNTRITGEVSALIGSISAEETARQNADNNLQSQIDAITAASDVVDIVGTYAALQSYNTSNLQNNDIIKVLSDESRDNETTYYRWVITGNVGAWSFIGEEGPYYTKSEADSAFAPQTRTINGQSLDNNITLTASDVGALPSDTQIGNGTVTLTQGGENKGSFTLNQAGNVTIDFDAVSEDITVDSTLSTSSENPVQNKVITTALNNKQNAITDLVTIRSGAALGSTSLQPNDNISELNNNTGYITGISPDDVITALGYTPYSSSNPSGYITGITANDVASALGYTPYNSSNPAGYTSNIGTVTSVNNILPVDGNVTIENISGLQLFDIVLKDHILNYEESKGFAQLGTYVYKEALAGSRYGYPDFYQTVLDEYHDANNTSETVSGVTITVNANGHKFYDISDKSVIDDIYSNTGEAWYYGIDIENERVFLPRSTRIKFAQTSSEVGQYQEAGLPYIKAAVTGNCQSVNSVASGAFSLEFVESWTSGPSQSLFRNATLRFDASSSNSIYGNSSTVEYSSTKMIPYMVVGNVSDWAGMTDIVNQGMEILEQVNQGIESRVDIDLSNLSGDGKAMAASMASPSDKYISLATGASGSEYTAPYNGYFNFAVESTGNNNYLASLYVLNEDCLIDTRVTENWSTAGVGLHCFLPAKKGQTVFVRYENANLVRANFVPLQGEV